MFYGDSRIMCSSIKMNSSQMKNSFLYIHDELSFVYNLITIALELPEFRCGLDLHVFDNTALLSHVPKECTIILDDILSFLNVDYGSIYYLSIPDNKKGDFLSFYSKRVFHYMNLMKKLYIDLDDKIIRCVQRKWKSVITNPNHPACQRRLLYEYNQLKEPMCCE